MRKIFNGRSWGTVVCLAVYGVVNAQITVGTNPNGFKSDYSESFEEYPVGTPNVFQTFTPSGVSIFGGAASIQATNPSDGSEYAIYDATTPTHTASNPWGLGSANVNAGVYDDGGYRGFGFENVDSAGAPADVTIALANGKSDTYFGGYFQTATVQGDPNSGDVTFAFYNQANTLISGQSYSIATNPSANAGALQGITFTFNAADPYSYVVISGDTVAMDSLRIAANVSQTPEPPAFAVLALGFIGLRRRKRRE